MTHVDVLERALGARRLGRWLTPSRLAWLGVWLGGASMTCSMLRLSFEPSRDEWQLAAAVLASTTVWSSVALVTLQSLIRQDMIEHGSFRLRLNARSFSRSLIACGLFGWANAACAFGAVELMSERALGSLSCFGAMCVGPVVGFCAGVLFGLFYVWIAWTAARAREIESFDHVETMQLHVGGWLTVAGAVGVVVGAAPSAEIAQAFVTSIGVVLIALAAARDETRQRALRFVRSGAFAELETRALRTAHPGISRIFDIDVAQVPSDGGTLEIVRWQRQGDGPFRTQTQPRVIGTIPGSERSVADYRTRRAALAVMPIVVAAWLALVFVTSERPSAPRRSLPGTVVRGFR